ncbi:hypothetical protein FE374_14615 [Georgenia yuyongxinii]|uniref:N-acetylmuramoyl-L-alanine amidase n=1 Tax=Georgenia yuyongxinii TaxID=2589797 RepID=A0A5B8C4I9_9MICO|nr:cell wall-binding repeat-containing protein [Georgenia yuyongxinii]QDC25679.1 hypothetical protein FE374_14615 [Georgenia yuyongxinii]
MTPRTLVRPAALGLALTLLGVSLTAAPARSTDAGDAVPEVSADAAATAAAALASTTPTVEGAVPVEADVATVAMDGAETTEGPRPVEEVTVSGPGGDLVVVGVSWAEVEAGAGLTARLRSRDGETWSGWTDLEITAPLSAGEATAEMRGGTEPLAVMDADEIEVTLAGAPGTLPTDPELVVVDPGESAADANVPVGESPLGEGAVGAATGAFAVGAANAVPRIYGRADWGADESLRTWKPQIGKVTGVVVHHTAGANGYTAEAVPGIIRGIYTYHAKSLGWGDIGYNVLVDAYGRAWEGRSGGLTNAVIAAHAKGVNSTTFGISVMGNFDKIPVPDAAFRTVAQVVAWKFAVHGIATAGTATGVNGKAMKPVVGHRDVGNTACPGAYFYPRLGELTGLVDDYQALLPDDLSLTAGGVTRIGGADRYATAAATSRYAFPTADTVFITTGTQYADALSAGPAAVKLGAPILLVQRTAIPMTVHVELQRLRPSRIYVLGGPAAVADSVVTELMAYTGVTRLAGSDRYQTSAAVGRAGWVSAQTVYLASGQDFADGLAGGAAAAALGAPLYVTPGNLLTHSVKSELQRLGPNLVVLLGGEGALNAGVAEAVQQTLPGARVTRLAGSDRYDTAATIAGATWPNGSGVAFLATGTDFADALSGVPAAGVAAAPMLLTRPACLPRRASEALAGLTPTAIAVFGGTGAVKTSALNDVC